MAVIVYSGGLDSTVLLYKYASEGRALEAISVDYGQRHKKELFFAEKNCRRLGVPFHVVDLSSLGKLLGGNSLTDVSTSVPNGDYNDLSMKTTVVPNRNMILIALAASRAIAAGCDAVAYAAHNGDHALYPDCREEFASALNSTLAVCHYTTVRLERPFVDMTKADIVRLGASLGVDFKDTWSCYKGGEKHCGKCGTCSERREAFALAGVSDPTDYED